MLTSDSVPASFVQHLASPIHLQPASLTKPACNSSSKPHCSRVPVSTIRRQRTSRQSAKSRERASHTFDSLPWIAVLDSSADSLSLDPCDIADLSQIPVPSPGALRRRRDSSRQTMKDVIPDNTFNDVAPSSTIFGSSTESELSAPATPRTPFDPSRVSFQQLMPVLSD